MAPIMDYDEKTNTVDMNTVGIGEVPVDIEIDAKDSSGRQLKTTASGVVLVPQPSDDPEDPLVCLCRERGEDMLMKGRIGVSRGNTSRW